MAYAYVQREDGAYQRRDLRLGHQGDDLWEVLEGLQPGDRVVTAANFLIDAESNLKAALQSMAAPKSAADFAFLLHGFHYLKPEGVMAIILPHGVLFRGGAEERIRTKLLKDGNIDTLLGDSTEQFHRERRAVLDEVIRRLRAEGIRARRSWYDSFNDRFVITMRW